MIIRLLFSTLLFFLALAFVIVTIADFLTLDFEKNEDIFGRIGVIVFCILWSNEWRKKAFFYKFYSQVYRDIYSICKKRNIEVTELKQKVQGKYDGSYLVIDRLYLGNEYAVVLETRYTLTLGDIEEMSSVFQRLKQFLPQYREKKFLGILAFYKSEKKAEERACQEGFFIIKPGKKICINNAEDFKPVQK